MEPLGLFFTAPPGLEPLLADEARAAGFGAVRALPGGVEATGGWPEVWRAHLELRGAGRVLVRIAEFRAMHPAQLDKRSRKLDWASLIPPGTRVAVSATCSKSRIYHAGAAADRVSKAVADGAGAVIDKTAALRVMVRIEDDLCTLSLDCSGEALHKRGHKVAVGKAPLRETMAALFLRAMGFDGTQTVADPMCGSGTLPIEAAEIAAGLRPGRTRSFAFEHLHGFDADHWASLRAAPPVPVSDSLHHGSDRDDGAVRNATANAQRSGVADRAAFGRAAISAFLPPTAAPGIVLVNPPYGGRIGNRKMLFGLYGSLGQVLADHFAGWRVGVITSDDGLAKATRLPFSAPGPHVAHGGMKVRLWQTPPL